MVSASRVIHGWADWGACEQGARLVEAAPLSPRLGPRRADRPDQAGVGVRVDQRRQQRPIHRSEPHPLPGQWRSSTAIWGPNTKISASLSRSVIGRRRRAAKVFATVK
ncbi:hypothetical protein GCM10023178_20150 [Actinomadura luteofluorescens]